MMRAPLLIIALLFALPAEAQRPTSEEVLRAYPRLKKVRDLDLVAEPIYANRVMARSVHRGSVVGRVFERMLSGEVKLIRTHVETDEGNQVRSYHKSEQKIVRDRWWKLDSGVPGGLWIGVRTQQLRGDHGYEAAKIQSYMRRKGSEVSIYDVASKSLQRFGPGVRPEDTFRLAFVPSTPGWVSMARGVIRYQRGVPRRSARRRPGLVR